MLIDDDEDDREICLSVLQTILPEASYIIATNGEDALQKLNNGNASPDLIFLDLNMPLMNGKQFLTEIKKNAKLSSVPIIILSTSSDQATIKETIDLGARDFVTKPDKYSAWEDALKKLLNKFALPR
jgi:CheY-like chemotaxis protein